MLVQVSLLCECSVTLGAHVLLPVCIVDHGMGPQVGFVGEGLAAAWVVALVRLLPSVGSHVSLQEPRARELFPADRTLVLLSIVSGRVMPERAEDREDPGANTAFVYEVVVGIVAVAVDLLLEPL